MITIERLREVLNYDPETGVFTWRVAPRGHSAGSRAGSLHRKWGYRYIGIDGKKYRAARLAWAHVTGKWPKAEVDHRFGMRGDDRFAELREATSMQNKQNQGLRSDNTSGHPGVSWGRTHCKWVAGIKHQGKRKHLGVFGTLEAAVEFRDLAKVMVHAFARGV